MQNNNIIKMIILFRKKHVGKACLLRRAAIATDSTNSTASLTMPLLRIQPAVPILATLTPLSNSVCTYDVNKFDGAGDTEKHSHPTNIANAAHPAKPGNAAVNVSIINNDNNVHRADFVYTNSDAYFSFLPTLSTLLTFH